MYMNANKSMTNGQNARIIKNPLRMFVKPTPLNLCRLNMQALIKKPRPKVRYRSIMVDTKSLYDIGQS